MSGAHRSSSSSRSGRSGKKGHHRLAPKPSRQPYHWLGVGAMTLGLGAAMAGGTGVAGADTKAAASPSSTSATGSDTSTPAADTSSTQTRKGQKHQKQTTPASDTAASLDKGTATGGSSAAGSSTAGAGAGARNKKAKTTQSSSATATVTAAASSAATTKAATLATAVATPTTATTATATVSVAALPSATASTTTTTPQANSTDQFIASLKTALVSYLTSASAIAQLTANGLNGPVAPSNFISALVYGFYRNTEQFAGLVPKAGTPSTTSDPATGTVTGSLNFTEPAGVQLTYSTYTNPLYGSVKVDSNGTYTYKSNVVGSVLATLGLKPTDSFTITASDGVASTNETVTVPVISANNTPSTPIATNVHENIGSGVVTGTLSSTSPDSTAVTYHVVTGPVGGSVTVDGTTGAFTYTPTTLARTTADLGVITTDTFTVTASNGTGATSSIGFVTVPVSPASNDTPSAPVATNVNANAVTGAVTGTISSTDPAGSSLTYTATQPLGGTVTLNDTTGAFTYTPSGLARTTANLGVITTDTFSVTASNGTYSTSALITVPVAPAANDTPSTPTSSSLTLNTTTGVVTGTLTSTSPDGGTISYHVTALATQGSVTVSGNTYTYTPSALAQAEASLGLITTDTFSVTATNAAGYTSAIGYVTVPVNSISDNPTAPVVTNQSQNLVTGTVTGTISSVDPANQTLTYTVATKPVGGSVTVNTATGAFTYTPSGLARTTANLGVITTDSFTVTASNGTYSTSALITVPVSPASNDTPTTPLSASQHQNIYTGVVTGTVSATSPDNSALSYTITTPTLSGLSLSTGTISIDNSTGAYTYTPSNLARGTANLGVITTDSFTVTATNAAGYSSSTTISVPISPASNDTPSAPTASNITENTATGVVTGTLTSVDPAGGAVTYAVNTGPIGGTVSISGSTFTYTPTALARTNANLGVITTDTFTVTASNGSNTSNAALVTVPISPASNDTPTVPVASNITMNSGTGVVTGTLTSTSPDGAGVTYSALGLPTQGSITITGNTFTYVPTSLAQLESQITLLTTGHDATDTFGITASNGTFTSGMASVTVTISPVSDTPGAPTISNIKENTVTGVVTGTLSATDPAGLTLSYTVSSAPVGGSVTIAGNTFTYTPTAANRLNANLGVITTDTFTVSATNGYYSSGASFVTVPVSPASNDTPTKPTATNVNENIYTGVVTGTLNSTSPDGSAVSYAVSGPALSTGTVTVTGNTFTYTPTNTARTNANLGVITGDSFTVTASNADFTSSSTTVSVPISPASNDTPTKPTASGQNENLITGVVTGTVSATSPDGGTVSYSVSGPALSTGSITVNSSTGAYTYTPTNAARTNANLGVITSDTVTVTATNALGISSSSTFTVPISAATNDTPTKPTAAGQVQNKTSGVVTGTISATSPDGHSVTYSVSGMTLLTGSVTINSSTGAYTYTPTALAMSNATLLGPYTDTFTVTATNGLANSSATVTVPILAKSLL